MMRRTRDKGGPSPWVPATILGVVLIIAVLPYMALPQPPVVYQKSPSFPLPLLLILVVLFVLAQWFSGSPSFGRSYSQGNRSFNPGAPRSMVWPQQQQQQRAWPWSRPGGYGQWDANDRYAGYNQSWTSDIWRCFMDYSGHCLLILLGIALFAMEELDRCRRKDVFWMPSMWTVGLVQGSLPELDHGLGVATVTMDGVEKACCSFDSQEFGKALSGPHITHKLARIGPWPLGVATVIVDGVEKAYCSFDSQEFGKALSGPHIIHKNHLDIVVEFVF